MTPGDDEPSSPLAAQTAPLRRAAGVRVLRANCLDLAWHAAFDPGLILRLIKNNKAEGLDAIIGRPHLWSTRGASRGNHSGPTEHLRTPTPADVTPVTWVDPAYPSRLRHLHDPPPAIFVRGRVSVLAELEQRPLVAVVGARAASSYGLEMTATIVDGLVRAGVGVVSGLALGIDAAAHREALAVLAPSKAGSRPVPLVAVLGCGVQMVHPRSNACLFEAMACKGLLLSEYFWDLPAQAWRFPARNRIIAALADALVIVEGKKTSGARHTAAFASELPCDVFAVPGEAGRRLSELPHELIRYGAHLCESADDVLHVLESRRMVSTPVCFGAGQRSLLPSRWAPGSLEAKVVDALDGGVRSVDELSTMTGSPVAEVVGSLTRLHIDGLVTALGANRYRLLRRESARRAEVSPVQDAVERAPKTQA